MHRGCRRIKCIELVILAGLCQNCKDFCLCNRTLIWPYQNGGSRPIFDQRYYSLKVKQKRLSMLSTIVFIPSSLPSPTISDANLRRNLWKGFEASILLRGVDFSPFLKKGHNSYEQDRFSSIAFPLEEVFARSFYQQFYHQPWDAQGSQHVCSAFVVA